MDETVPTTGSCLNDHVFSMWLIVSPDSPVGYLIPRNETVYVHWCLFCKFWEASDCGI